MYHDWCVALLYDAMGLYAVCDYGISLSYLLTFFNRLAHTVYQFCNTLLARMEAFLLLQCINTGKQSN